MYDKCYFCLDQLPKLKKESTASFFVNFGGAGVQKSRPTLLYWQGSQHEFRESLGVRVESDESLEKAEYKPKLVVGVWATSLKTVCN